jgi:hypothetical protein
MAAPTKSRAADMEWGAPRVADLSAGPSAHSLDADSMYLCSHEPLTIKGQRP